MTYDEYNKAVAALKAPGDLTIFEEIKWLEDKIKALREKLTASDLKRVLDNEKRFLAKMTSSLR